ncbi:nuclear transport factor 2-like isoform X2 [Silene latifolia]|uniref:nuclear transport factor 2-like isoform X2 n=1 Tax=Silene latifolia TaxID=37657 RepID=UPI003D771D20
MDAHAYETMCHYFTNHYYHVLCETPEISHRFYGDSSTVTHIDADHTETVSTRQDIRELLIFLSVTEVGLSELTVQISWNGGILIIVTGNMESRNFIGKRKFSQTFFLAPLGIFFYILNDILQIQDQVPELLDIMVDEQPAISVSSYELEETREDDSPIDKYSLPDDQQHQDLQFQPVVEEASVEQSSPLQTVVEEASVEQSSPLQTVVEEVSVEQSSPLQTVVEEASVEQSSPLQTVVNHLEDPIHWPALPPASARADELAVKPASESAAEPARLSYASILQATKRQCSPSFVPRQPSVRQSKPASDLQLKIQGNEQQLNSSTSSVLVPKKAVTGEDDILVKVELTSVLVGNLPPHVTNADLEKEFKNFGKIKRNGVSIRSKTETGVCYAFVEFEDKSGLHNAIKASTIKFLGNQVYIEERIVSSSTAVPVQEVELYKEAEADTQAKEMPLTGTSTIMLRGSGFQQRPYQ